ncbi:LysR family transcriptional regulator ArgP [Vibrio mangrovi]|uniref:HTH-type transcriptional regulator ArgP n=1 Tax=Vibrio mangrovi TaxID=474394 RepID=A0A1Y6ISQ2_9VIBR|nr:LysR family transcriptional regulator ArgP [Vibrio mangrovi]MDW6001911.1 LysR family transcriptional regulator ArgP [Vibrio mangrovi]SMS00061.1 Chromosome initiation inhibitor [Vibrio mangrovi]
MRGLDYRWIEALDRVILQGSFERAADDLCISQSAVSQRIKQLERFLAQPVLVREQPLRLTVTGTKLIGLYRKVCLLEQELIPDFIDEIRPVSVSIASNADSLATWLLPALIPVMQAGQVELNIQVTLESRTIDKLKSGEVAGAISLESEPLNGCIAEYLGRVDYLCVATPAFHQQYFSSGVCAGTLKKAPAICFDQHDQMHQEFLKRHFGISTHAIIHHTIASSEAFVKLALSGTAYCLISEIQIQDELARGTLINITPDYVFTNEMYWHHWQLETGVMRQISHAVLNYARLHLPQSV